MGSQDTPIESRHLWFTNSDSPTSDNLTPQKTTNQLAPDMEIDGVSCPVLVGGVANEDLSDAPVRRLTPLTADHDSGAQYSKITKILLFWMLSSPSEQFLTCYQS